MNKSLLGGALVCAILGGGGIGWGQDLSGGILWAPNIERRVTITRNGEPMVSLTVPVGSIMSASYDERLDSVIRPGHWEFRGDVVIRVLPNAARNRARGVAEDLAVAPLVLTLSM